MDVIAEATSNWRTIAGTDISNAIQTKVTNSEDFIKPSVDDIISADRATLLSSGTMSHKPTCELSIRVLPKFKIDSITLICTTPKIELFLGNEIAYLETVYGEQLEDEDDSSEGNDGYRYDVEITKSGVTNLMLKMLTRFNELCIYGILLYVAPNPAGITTQLPNKINLDNVKEMLNNSNQKLSPSAEKCKTFLETYSSAMSSNSRSALLAEFKKRIDDQTEEAKAELAMHQYGHPKILKNYVDKKIKEAEGRIIAKITEVEKSLSVKLDQILSILQTSSDSS